MKGLLAALHAGAARTSPKPLMSRSCNRVGDVLRNVLNDAMCHGRVARDAAELAKPLPLDDVSRRAILKPEHVPAFVEMCERNDMGALWMLALCSARRESSPSSSACAGPTSPGNAARCASSGSSGACTAARTCRRSRPASVARAPSGCWRSRSMFGAATVPGRTGQGLRRAPPGPTPGLS
jgi:hypothetical protein